MSREAMQMALDALENLDGTEFPEQTKAITALRAALAERPAEWIGCGECDPMFKCYDSDAACVRLPTEQPAAPVLTDEQIIRIRQRTGATTYTPYADSIAFARAILAAAIPPGYCVVKDDPVAWFHNDHGVLELSRIRRVGWTPLCAARTGEPT